MSRLKPWGNTEGGTEFSGWARMALPVATFSVVEVGAPTWGKTIPPECGRTSLWSSQWPTLSRGSGKVGGMRERIQDLFGGVGLVDGA